MLRDNFCILEKDEKTFNYVKRYILAIKKESSEHDVEKLDCLIQMEEMKNHLIINNIPEDKKNNECIRWADENSEKFRIYLNSIKIVSVIFYEKIKQNGDIDLNFKNFESISDTINNLKFKLINTIFLK